MEQQNCRDEACPHPHPCPRPHSHLFTVRIWEEVIDTDQREWRGKIQLFTSGDVRYFREWATLVPLFLTMLSESNLDKQPDDLSGV